MLQDYLKEKSYFIWIVGLVSLGALLWVILAGLTWVLVAGLSLIFLGWLASRYPLWAVSALIGIVVIPTLFSFLPGFVSDYSAIGRGLLAEDVVLLAMSLAVARKILGGAIGVLKTDFFKYGFLLGLWLVFETVRNISSFGISAPGEFRFRYLVLVLPFFIASHFGDSAVRRQLLRILIYCLVVAPMVALPIVGSIIGWRFGAESRYFPAEVSLGLVYGLSLLILCKRGGVISWPTPVILLATIVGVTVVVVDTHRSVWLAAGVAIVTLALLHEIKLSRILKITVMIGVALALLAMIQSSVREFIFQYIPSRAAAFINPESDHTASWRLAIWTEAIGKIQEAPILGEGFGEYWTFDLPQFGEVVTVSPHNFYIQSLIKIGLIGLALYLIMMWKLGRRLRRLTRGFLGSPSDEISLVLGCTVLVAAHFFYLVYTLDYLSLVFIGIGASVVFDPKRARNGIDPERK